MIPQLPIRNPFFDDKGNLTVPWLRFLESLTRQNVLRTPEAPVAVVGELLLEDPDAYGIKTTITPPAPLGDVVLFEVQAQFWDSATGGAAQSEWITLGTVDAAAPVLVSGYWPLPTTTSYCLLRARSTTYQQETSDWVEATSRFSVLSGAAPNVRFFRAGTSNGNGTFALTTRVDTLGERVLVDWAAMRPQQLSNWSHFRIFCRTANGDYVDTTGPRDDLSFQEIDGEWVIYDTIALEGSYLPTAAENWQFIAVSANRAGELNRDGSDNPTGPSVTLSIQRPVGTLVPPPQLAAGDWSLNTLQYSIDEAGASSIFISATITNLAPGADYYSLFWQKASTPVSGDWIEIAADATAGTWREWPSAGASYVIAIAANKASYKLDQPDETITSYYKTLTIPAWGEADQVTGFSVTVETQNRAGVPSGRFVFAFTKPNDPDYYYAQISRIACDSSYNPLGGASYEVVAGEVNPTKQLEWWPLPGTKEYWKFKAESVNYRKVVNTTGGPTSNVEVSNSTGITQVAPATLTTAAFASTIKPVEIVNTLPGTFTNYPQGAVVFLTTDNKLYRSTGSAWTVATDGADIVANSITGGKIAAGAISTTELAAAEILVGSGGGKPSRFTVVENSNVIGFIGSFPSPAFTGGYFKNLLVAPSLSTTATPRIYATSAGVLELVGVRIESTATGAYGSGTVRIDPSNTYSPVQAENLSTTSVGYVSANAVGVKDTNTSNAYPFIELARSSGSYAELKIFGGLASTSPQIILTCTDSTSTSSANFRNVPIQISGTTVIDSSRNVDAATLKVGGTTVIDSSRNMNGATIQVGGTTVIDSSRNVDGVSIKVGGTTVIDSSRNVDGATIKVGGTTVVDSSRNITGGYVKTSELRLGGSTSSNSLYFCDSAGDASSVEVAAKVSVKDDAGNFLGYLYLMDS